MRPNLIDMVHHIQVYPASNVYRQLTSSIFILSVHISTSGNEEGFDGKWATIYYRENEDRVIQSTGDEFNKYNHKKGDTPGEGKKCGIVRARE